MAPVVLLSHRFWQERLGADSTIIGRSLVLHPSPSFDTPRPEDLHAGAYEVIGVLPAAISVPLVDADIWVPLEVSPRRATVGSLRVIARLAPDATRETAATELTAIESRLRSAHPEITTNTVRVVPIVEQVVGDIRPTLLLLAASVAFVLLMACANVASVLLTRALARGREMTIRVALGATSGRLVRQMLTETVLLATVSGILSLLVANWWLRVIVALTSADALGSAPSTLDRPALAVTLVYRWSQVSCSALRPLLRPPDPRRRLP